MPQQPNYDALAKRFNGAEAVDYDALAAQTQAPAPSQPLMDAPDIRGVPRRIVEGAGRMLLPSTTPSDYIEGPLYAAQHPLDALKLLLEAIGGATTRQGQKAAEAVRATATEPTASGRLGRVSEAIGHSAAAVIPVLGPAAAETGERFASGDIAGGIGQTAGLLAPMVGPRGVSAVAGQAKTATAGLRGSLADAAARGIERRFVDVAAPKTGANKVRFGNDVAKVAPALAREEGLGAGSRTGLQSKVEGRLAEAETALDEASNARLSARTFPTKPILDALRERRRRLTAETVNASGVKSITIEGLQDTSKPGVSGQEFGIAPPTKAMAPTNPKESSPQRHGHAQAASAPSSAPVGSTPFGQDVVPGPNTARVAEIDRAIAEIEQLGPSARYEPLRRIREAYDGPAKTVYSPSMTADFLKAKGGQLGAADVTGVLREHLATMDPQTAAANAEYSLFRKAADAMKAAEETERVRPNMFRKTMGRVTGAATGGAAGGGYGAVAGVLTADFLDAVARSGVTTKIQTARLLSTLEDALRGQRTSQVQSTLAKLRLVSATVSKTSVGAGRVQTASGR